MIELFDISSTVLLRVLYLALFAVASVATGFLAKWLKEKAEAEKADIQIGLSGSQRFALETAITVAVQAAQQVKDANADKFIYAKGIALQAAQALGIALTDSQLDALIESAVYELKQATK